MADNISYIHSNKLAKHNYRYIGKDGTVYIGQKDGRLAKQESTGIENINWGAIQGNITNQQDLTTYINNIVNNIVNNNTTIIQEGVDYSFLLMGA